VLSHAQRALGVNAAAIQYPIGKEGGFIGEIDIINRVGWQYTDNKDDAPERDRIPAELKDKVEAYRMTLIEKLANFDDDLMMMSSMAKSPVDSLRKPSAKPPSPRSSSRSLRHRLQEQGIQPLLDAVIDYLPSPLDIPGEKGELEWQTLCLRSHR
jgi:elongation factor G